MAALGETTFTAHRARIVVWVRGKRVAELAGHHAHVHLLCVVGSLLVSIDKESWLMTWDAVSFERAMDKPLALGANVRVRCVVHPTAYLNKILLGAEDGRLFLWNFKSCQLVYTFAGWGAAITCVAQSPALDVVGCGLADGRIVLHNLKTDTTVMVLRHVDAGVTSLSFRSDHASAPLPMLVSGDTNGALAVWDLNKRSMLTLVKNAHRSASGGVASVAFLLGEPVMVTAGAADNALRMWIFDAGDHSGEPRLLRERTGHSAPPRVILFRDENTLLSGGGDGALRVVSIIQDHRSKEISQKALKRVTNGKYKRFPPVLGLSYSDTRRKEWSCMVTVHAGMAAVWPWGADKLADHAHRPPGDGSAVTCATLTRCGNFALAGTAAGSLHRVNVQSGQWRGTVTGAHTAAIEGVATDILETVAVTCGLDGFVRFWQLSDLAPLNAFNVGSPVSVLTIHREGGLVAVASDDWCIRVFDLESRSLVRLFTGHSNQITSMCFSGDCKWLVSASADGSVRTWDIVSAHCVDAFVCPKPAVAVAFSPRNDLLATAHVDDVGIYIWSNKAHFSQVFLRPVDDARLATAAMPAALAEHLADGDADADAASDGFFCIEELEDEERDRQQQQQQQDAMPLDGAGGVWEFLRQLPAGDADAPLVKLSGEPETKFMALVQVDEIKERNKPRQPVAQPIRAPFQLPTVPGVALQFQLPAQATVQGASHVLRHSEASSGPLSRILRECASASDWSPLAERLKGISASAVDAEIRLLSVERDGEELGLFVHYLVWQLEMREDFDLLQGYLHSFLNAHGETLVLMPGLKSQLSALLALQGGVWQELEALLHRTSCAVQLTMHRATY